MSQLIITCAVQGAEVTREQTPYLPITVEEVAEQAADACAAGAAVIHLHVRDAAGRPTQDRGVFAAHIAAIRSRCDAIIQVTTGAEVGMSDEVRLQPLALRPEMASLNAGSINFGGQVFANSQGLIRRLAREMDRFGVTPEIEVFDTAFVSNGLALLQEGLVSPPLHFNFVMGVPGGMAADLPTLVYLTQRIPGDSTWSVSGIGRHQLTMALAAMVMGGHVRVGLEDNIYYRKGELAVSNAQLVARVVRIAGELGRPVASPDEARRILKLPGRDSS